MPPRKKKLVVDEGVDSDDSGEGVDSDDSDEGSADETEATTVEVETIGNRFFDTSGEEDSEDDESERSEDEGEDDFVVDAADDDPDAQVAPVAQVVPTTYSTLNIGLGAPRQFTQQRQTPQQPAVVLSANKGSNTVGPTTKLHLPPGPGTKSPAKSVTVQRVFPGQQPQQSYTSSRINVGPAVGSPSRTTTLKLPSSDASTVTRVKPITQSYSTTSTPAQPQFPVGVQPQPQFPVGVQPQPQFPVGVQSQPQFPVGVQPQPQFPVGVQSQPQTGVGALSSLKTSSQTRPTAKPLALLPGKQPLITGQQPLVVGQQPQKPLVVGQQPQQPPLSSPPSWLPPGLPSGITLPSGVPTFAVQTQQEAHPTAHLRPEDCASELIPTTPHINLLPPGSMSDDQNDEMLRSIMNMSTGKMNISTQMIEDPPGVTWADVLIPQPGESATTFQARAALAQSIRERNTLNISMKGSVVLAGILMNRAILGSTYEPEVENYLNILMAQYH